MKKFYFGFIASILLLANMAQAQLIELEAMSRSVLRDMGAIISNNEVKGYYELHKLEKADKKNNLYLLSIYDPNLTPLGNDTITDSKYVMLRESVYNGKVISFRFFNAQSKEYTIRCYNTNAEELKSYTIKASNPSISQENTVSTEVQSDMIHAVGSEGFAFYQQESLKKFTIKYIPSDPSKPSWEYLHDENSYDYATFLGASNNIILTSVVRRPGLMSREMDTYVMGIDAQTGKKLFLTKVEDKAYQVTVMNAYIDDATNQVSLIGIYHFKDDKTAKTASQGLAMAKMDLSGNISGVKYMTWLKDVRKFMPVNAKGKIEDVGYIFFHKFIVLDNGSVFGVGEQFNKVASGAGIAIRMIGGTGISMAKVVTEDLMLFEFSPEFELKHIEIVPKYKSSIELPQGYEMVSTQLLGQVVKSYNGFDYEFTQVKSKSNQFFTGYFDYERKPKEDNTWIFGTCSYAEGEYKIDKMEIDNKASQMKVYPGKPGYILVASYFSKTKKATLELKKLNN